MKIKNQILYLVAILSVTFLTFSCSETSEDVVRLPSIVEIAKADPANFSILVSALTKTGLATTLDSPGSYTVFAPTNAAFSKIPPYDTAAKIDALNPAVPADLILINNLRSVLQNHVIGVGTRSSDLLAAGYTRTFAFYRAAATSTSGPNISMFISKPAADVLINGGATSNPATNIGAKVITADIEARNGVLHVIDNVLVAQPTIVQHVQANPNLSSLLSVVTSPAQSTVLTTLASATNLLPLTVYAPNNAAFTAASAPGGYLVGKTDAQITSILNYHLERSNRVAATATAFNATADVTVTTLFVPAPTVPITPVFTFVIPRASLRIVDRSTPAVNANAVVTNIQGTNGSIQIVDKVMRSL